MKNKVLAIVTSFATIMCLSCNPESGHWRYNIHADDIDFQIEADFAGLIVRGSIGGKLQKEFVGELINGIVDRVVKLPVDFRTRTDELYWNIKIPQGDHTATLKWLNPQEDAGIEVRSYIEFTNTPPVELEYRTVK